MNSNCGNPDVTLSFTYLICGVLPTVSRTNQTEMSVDEARSKTYTPNLSDILLTVYCFLFFVFIYFNRICSSYYDFFHFPLFVLLLLLLLLCVHLSAFTALGLRFFINFVPLSIFLYPFTISYHHKCKPQYLYDCFC